MNTIIQKSITAFLLVICISGARAEYIFTKDGKIIEGKIVGDRSASITIKTPAKNEIVKVNEILRIQYADLYLGKVYIRMTSGETQEGYIVDEDSSNLTVRKDITKPYEYKVPRSKVMFIARSNPTDLSWKVVKSGISLKWNPPFVPGEKYRVYLKTNSDKDFALTTETSRLNYTIRAVKSNTKYYIYVTSMDAHGIESLPSELITVSTQDISFEDSGTDKQEDGNSGNSPGGLSAYCLYFRPLTAPFKSYYDSLGGFGVDYYFNYNDHVSFGAGMYYATGDGNADGRNVSLYSASLNCRVGSLLFDFMYPYLGISGRGTLFTEKTDVKNDSFPGYGGDISAGCAFMLTRNLSLWADCAGSFVWLKDNSRTDIHGCVIRGGVSYRF